MDRIKVYGLRKSIERIANSKIDGGKKAELLLEEISELAVEIDADGINRTSALKNPQVLLDGLDYLDIK